MTQPYNTLLLSTAYLPPLEYFAFIIKSAKVQIDIFETYPRQTWRNRCAVLTANGVLNLSIPVEKPYGNSTRTADILISGHSSWQKNHIRTIEAAYRNSPYYIFYRDLVEDFIMTAENEKLHELNHRILLGFCRELEIKTTIAYTTEFVSTPLGMTDLRFCISPKPKDRLHFPEPVFEPYYQTFNDKFGFAQNLSILDLLFNLGPDSTEYLNSVKL